MAVLVPSNDYWLADFAISVLALQQLLALRPLSSDFKHNLINERGSLIAYQRENLADKALEGGATHLLWLDSDMRFPSNLAHRLFAHDLPIVGCNYVKRKIPAFPNSKNLDDKLISTTRESTGLAEISSAGFGAMLIKREVFEKTPKPWFDQVWLDRGEEGISMLGEDVFFFQKVRKVGGFRAFIDHDASQKVSHIGTFDYDNALCEATWDEIGTDEQKARVVA